MNTETFAVIKRIVHGVDLKFTSVARAGINLPDGETSFEALSDGFFQLDPDPLDIRVRNRRQWLSDDAGVKYLFKDSYHETPDKILNPNSQILSKFERLKYRNGY